MVALLCGDVLRLLCLQIAEATKRVSFGVVRVDIICARTRALSQAVSAAR